MAQSEEYGGGEASALESLVAFDFRFWKNLRINIFGFDDIVIPPKAVSKLIS